MLSALVPSIQERLGMTQSKNDAREQARRVASHRHITKSERENQRRRLVIITTVVAVAIAFVSVISGLIYDQVIIPAQTVATVGNVNLSREMYIREKRLSLAANMAQNLLLASFGGQFAERFQKQNPYLESQIAGSTLTEEPDGQIIAEWVQNESLRQAAKTEYQLVESEGRADQALVADYGMVFGETATPLAITATLVPTLTPGGPTATAEPEPTNAPPTATPDEAKAKDVASKIVDTIFTNYTTAMQPTGAKPVLTRDDFLQALQRQYVRQSLVEQVKEKLLPAETYTASTEPTGIYTSQIFVRVDVPQEASAADKDALYAAQKMRADEIIAKLKAGADFATLAETESDDYTSRKNGGTMDSFDLTGKSVAGSQYDAAYVTAAIALKPNEIVAAPVRTDFGWHVIKLNSVTVPSVEEQLRDARTTAFETWFTALETKYPVSYAVAPTATIVPAPTGEPAPLPTAPLAGYPTSTVTPVVVATATATATAKP
jgi:hypothetical protein